MTEVLPLTTGLFGKSRSTEELNTLHAWPTDLTSTAISPEEQRDLQQISQFRERVEKEIEVRRHWFDAASAAANDINYIV